MKKKRNVKRGKNNIVFLLVLIVITLVQTSNVSATNIRWSGGTGNWDDSTRWVLPSGMPYLQVPTANDDIYFDANSFDSTGQTLIVNISVAVCHSINFTGALNSPTFFLPANKNLKIFGSVLLINNMNLEFHGNVSFESASVGNTIKMCGKHFLSSVSFNGFGEWILLDSFYSASCLYLNSGVLNTNNQPVTIYSFCSTIPNQRSLILGSSIVTITGGGASAFIANFKYFTLNQGTSTFKFTNSSDPFVSLRAIAADTDIVFNNVEFMFGNAIDSIRNSTGYPFKFKKLSIAGNGVITGSNFCDSLVFSAGKTNTISAGTTQTFKNLSITNSACGNATSVYSSISEVYATFNNSNGTITVENIIVKDIHASGFTINALNSISISNTTGWNISPPANSTSNYYWVGINGGNWSDLNNWSSTSGGLPTSTCLPSAGNSVIFDGNSFSSTGKTVNIDVGTAYCKSLICSGNLHLAVITGNPNNAIKIFGSLVLNNSITFSFPGKTYFESNLANNTITTAGSHFMYKVFFTGAGTWTLQDAFASYSTLDFHSGTLITNNMPVSVNVFISMDTCNRTLNLGSSLMTINANDNYGFNINNFKNFNFDAGTSTIRFNYSGPSSLGIASNNSPYDVHFFNVDFTGNSCTALILNSTGKTFFFNNVTFACNAAVYGNNQYDGKLTFSAGMNYSFQSGLTQTIDTLIANGSCQSIINIRPLTNGSPAIFKKSNGTVNLDYVIIKYINATGGATWNASNSDNMFSSSGWITTPLPGYNLDFFWIGYDKNWNNPLNWSFTSGGTPNASGCIPGPSNNVIFDDNSFTITDSVNINIRHAFCKDMIWNTQYTPKLTGSSLNTLHIYRSLIISNLIIISFSGKTYFESTSANNYITSGGSVFTGSICFDAPGGIWSLTDSLTCLNTIYLYQGSLNTNNNNVKVGFFYSNTSLNRILTLGSSQVTITEADANVFYIRCANLQFNPGTSTIKFTNNTDPSTGLFITDANHPINFYDVKFTGANSIGIIDNNTSQIIGFHDVYFYGKGIINGSNDLHDVIFYKMGTINSSNSFNMLTFKPGNSYTLKSGTTQTIHSYFWAQGTCTAYIFIMSSSNGQPASIINQGAQVPCYNLHIRDIHYSNSVFVAYNSINLGGNSGFSFQTLMPMADLQAVNGATSVCEGSTSSYYISPVEGAIFYQWDVPDGASVVSGQGDTLVVIHFNAATTGNISVSAWSGCSYSPSSLLMLTINPKPSVEAGADQIICQGASANLLATGGGTYHWNTGSTSSTVVATPLSSTVYFVTATDLITGCSAEDSVTVFVNHVNANAGDDQTLCSGSSASLFASGGSNYIWSPASSLDNPYIFNPTATPSVNTTYTVTVTDSTGCSAIDSLLITVIPMPHADAGSDVTICEGSAAILHATGGTTYQWSDGSAEPSISLSPLSTTTYTVTAFNGSCASTDTVIIFVNTLPSATISSDVKEGCGPLEVHFKYNTSSIITAHLWDFGDGAESFAEFPTHVYNSPGAHEVSLTITDFNGCQATISIPQMITVYPYTAIDFTWDLTHADEGHYIFNFTPSYSDPIISWLWDFGDNNNAHNTSNISDPNHIYSDSGTYYVTLWVQSIHGCNDSLMKEVLIKEVTDFFIPNSFTPDGDGLNDFFFPVINNTVLEAYNFKIFDRWGEIVFETNDVAGKWNGAFKGGSQPLPEGVYVWNILYKGKKQMLKMKKGTVTLLR